MRTWFETMNETTVGDQRVRNIDRETEAQMRLNKQRDLARRTKPLEDQVTELMRSLPPALCDRPWTMEELTLRLQGKYRDRPHTQHVGTALRKLGWQRVRLYGEHGGVRLWVPPTASSTKLSG